MFPFLESARPKLVMAHLCLRDRHPWMRVWCEGNTKLACSFFYELAHQQMTTSRGIEMDVVIQPKVETLPSAA